MGDIINSSRKDLKSICKKLINMTVFAILVFFTWNRFTSPGFVSFLVELRGELARTNLLLFGLAAGIYLLSIIMIALSRSAVLEMFGSSLHPVQLIPIWAIATFVNNITPVSGAGGELVRIHELRRRFGLPYSVATLAVVLGRLIDIVPVALIGVMGIPVLVQYHILSWQQLALIGTAFLVIMGFLVCLIWRKGYILALCSKLFRYLLRDKQSPDNSHFSIQQTAYSAAQKRACAAGVLYASAYWAMALVRMKVLSLALGAELSYSAAAVVIIWYAIIAFLAFTPGGLGIIEGGITACLMLVGMSPPQALALAILDRSISYLLSTGIGAVYIFFMGGKRMWIRSLNWRRQVS